MLTFVFTALLLDTGLSRLFNRGHFLAPGRSELVWVDLVIVVFWGKLALVLASDSYRLETLILQLLIDQLILFIRIVHYFFPVSIYLIVLVWLGSLLKVCGWPLFLRVLSILILWSSCLLIVKGQFLIKFALPLLLLLLIIIPIVLLLVIGPLWRLFIGRILLIIIEKVEVVRVDERGLAGVVLILVLIVVVLLELLTCVITALFLIVVVVILRVIHFIL